MSVTRRQALRAGTVAGATLAWSAPVVVAVARPALAVGTEQPGGGGGVDPAPGAVLGYRLEIFDDINQPQFRLVNESTAAEITAFRFTIGRLDKNFDGVDQFLQAGTFTITRVRPDGDFFGGQRSQDVAFTFSGFGPLERFRFRADVDNGDGSTNQNTVENYRRVFFGNDGGGTVRPNSLVEVTFSTGGTTSPVTLSQVLPEVPPEGPAAPMYVFSQSQPV